MARTERDLEAYLSALGRSWTALDDGTLVIETGDGPPTVIRVAGSLVVASVLIGDAPLGNPEREARMYRRLLEHNASDLVYASYGLEHGRIVLSAALELENLDMNEFEAVLGDIDLALARHVGELRELSKEA
ncbi:MAG: YbjN domain-containing protein [Polyangiaceae bacterium]|nr:YbjN domain-containing protein [Polyangiaceae bacterium]